MARDFVPTARYVIAASVVTDYPVSMACWANADTLATSQTAMDLGSTLSGNGQRVFMNASGVNAESSQAGGTRIATTTAAPTTGTWHHIAGVFASATDRRAFLDGGNKGTSTDSRTWSADIDRTLVASRLRSNTFSQTFDGRLAEVAIWDVALSDDDVASLAKGFRPTLIRPDRIVMYSSLISTVFDYVGGNTMTLTGTANVAVHPRRIA